MISALEGVLEAFASGKLSRREAAKRTLAIALASVGAANVARATDESATTFRATGLNHLGLRVRNVPAARDFYQKHLGLGVIRDSSPGNCFLRAGNNYMGLFRSATPGFDHFCFTVDGFDPDQAMAKLEQQRLGPRRDDNRVYFDDPDGLEVQVAGPWDSWPGPLPNDED